MMASPVISASLNTLKFSRAEYLMKSMSAPALRSISSSLQWNLIRKLSPQSVTF